MDAKQLNRFKRRYSYRWSGQEHKLFSCWAPALPHSAVLPSSASCLGEYNGLLPAPKLWLQRWEAVGPPQRSQGFNRSFDSQQLLLQSVHYQSHWNPVKHISHISTGSSKTKGVLKWASHILKGTGFSCQEGIYYWLIYSFIHLFVAGWVICSHTNRIDYICNRIPLLTKQKC